MPRALLTAADVASATSDLVVSPGTIITASAYEVAAQRGLEIVIGASVSAARPPSSPPRTDLASRIDHTNLAPDAVESDIITLCTEAMEHRFAAVCVYPTWVQTCARALRGSDVRICAVVGFPTGAHPTSIKVEEAALCVRDGAQEIDMVANAGWLKDARYHDYLDDVAAVRSRIGPGVTLKVIIEASAFNPDDIVRAATLAAHAGADFVKTSTGVYGKARVEDVQLLRRCLPAQVKIKAAGGIRMHEDAVAMIKAGADRIGTAASLALLWGAKT